MVAVGGLAPRSMSRQSLDEPVQVTGGGLSDGQIANTGNDVFGGQGTVIGEGLLGDPA